MDLVAAATVAANKPPHHEQFTEERGKRHLLQILMSVEILSHISLTSPDSLMDFRQLLQSLFCVSQFGGGTCVGHKEVTAVHFVQAIRSAGSSCSLEAHLP